MGAIGELTRIRNSLRKLRILYGCQNMIEWDRDGLMCASILETPAF
jgi:hypothetical protein